MLKIMVVDDDFIVRRGMCEAIPWASYGCEVVASAADGEEALPLIDAHLPDIVFCDVVMPRMNGIALLGAIRERWPWIKVVMVSAHDEAKFVREAMQQEAVDYLLKPFHEPDIMRVVKTVRDRISHERITLSSQTRQNPQALAEVNAHARAVSHALRGHEAEEAAQRIHALFYTIRAGNLQSKLLITSICVDLMMEIIRVLQDMNAGAYAGEVAGRLGRLTSHTGLDTLERELIRTVTDAAHWLSQGSSPGTRLAVQAQRMIETRYADLTITELADALHVSASYLQKLFKQEMGVTIRQYTINIRMEKAKELLRGTREKVYAIGAMVGYQDPDFFGKTFVRVVGMTPHQYRESQT